MPGPGRPPKPHPGPRPRPGPVPRPTQQPSPQGGTGASGGGGISGGAPDANPELLTRGNGPFPDWIMRDFTPGMHCNPVRDCLGEQDLWWMENLQPLASGNCVPAPTSIGLGGAGITNTSIPYYVTEVSLQTIPYMFAAFTNGAAYIINLTTGTATTIMAAATLNSAQTTYAVNYTGKGFAQGGFLIIDPNGYWDYGVTAVNTLTKIGATTGNAIATYAGRVWIATGNVLNFTDVNSYNSFAGAGGSATFSDQYLLNGMTCLYAANNYLYILGATSVDVLSNVTVSVPGGVTSFSRVNVLQGIGVLPANVQTVIGYNRGLVFYDSSGLYMLAGATPERLSERVQAIVRSPHVGSWNPSCGLANVNGELCLLFHLAIADGFSATPGNRSLTLVYQRHRWWCYSNTFSNNLNQSYITGVPNFAPNYGAWALVESGVNVWTAIRLLSPFGGFSSWHIRTKLWDGGRAFSEKQAINVGIAAQYTNIGIAFPTGITFTVDSEFSASPFTFFTLPTVPVLFAGGDISNAYALQMVKGLQATNQGYGSQFIGLTVKGDGTNVNVLECVALHGKQERNLLE